MPIGSGSGEYGWTGEGHGVNRPLRDVTITLTGPVGRTLDLGGPMGRQLATSGPTGRTLTIDGPRG